MKYNLDVSQEEYRFSVKVLEIYIQADKSGIRTLEGLSELVSPVARSLRTIALARGTQRFHRQPVYDDTFMTRFPRGFLYSFDKHARSRLVIIGAAEDRIVIHNYYRINNKKTYHDPKYDYYLMLPGSLSMVSDKSKIALACTNSGQNRVEYYPYRDPHDSKLQIGFSLALERAVKDLLPTL